MKKTKLLSIALALLLVLSACGTTAESSEKSEKLQVVSSFTIISDMARQIGGDLIDVYNLVPTGTDPHEYEPLPNDIKKAEDGDILLMNGMNLEGGKSGWFYKMVDSVGQNLDLVFELNEGVEPMYLSGDEGEDEEVNPHSFLSPGVGIQMAENLKEALIKVDPDNKEAYEKNAEVYLTKLNDIDALYKGEIEKFSSNLLVTSERAFQYMANRYGLDEAYVWEIDTEELGTPKQISSLVDLLKEKNPPVIFMESNVDARPLETVSNETGIPIFEEFIFSDEIGDVGDDVDTYEKLLNHNIRIMAKGLK